MSQANKEVSNALFQAYISKEPIEFVSKTYNLTEPEAYKTQDLSYPSNSSREECTCQRL